MSSTRITSQVILRKALPILHAKLNLIGNANRQYDDRFASTGASVSYGKIGPSLQIRLPIEPTVRRGAVANVQDTVEQTTTLNCSQILGSDMSFSDSDLTLNIDDFTERYIEPSMSVLASTMESDFAASMYKSVYQFVGAGTNGAPGTTPANMDPFLAAKVLMNRSLAPAKDRVAVIDSPTSRAMVEGLKSLYNPQQTISKQHRDGLISEGAGYRWYENDLLPTHTHGAQAGSPVIDGANQATTGNATGTLNTKGWTNGTTVTAGTVFTITGVYSVHPETKQKFGDQLQQFVVLTNPSSADGNYTADGSGKITLNINPGIVLAGGMQNVSALGADGATITIVSGSASTSYGQNLVFHKNAFAFVTADLELPKDMDMAYRATMDGISMRFLRGYDVVNMRYISRLDILHGYAPIRPKLAVRVSK